MARHLDSGVDCLHLLATSITTTGDARTLSAWVFRDGTGGSGLGRHFFLVDGANAEAVVFGTGAVNRAQTIYATPTETENTRESLSVWTHVAYRWSYTDPVSGDSLIDLFLNGSNAGQVTNNAGAGAAAADGTITDVHFGNTSAHNRNFDGDLAEFALWGRELSDTEIADLALGMNPFAIPTDLVMYVPVYGAANPEPDLTGNSRTLTINGTVPDAANHPTVDPLPGPTNPMAAAQSDTSILVSWDDVAWTESGFRVEQSPDGVGSWVDVSGNLAPDTLSYLDIGLTASTQYFYRVFAFDTAADSQASAVVDATTTGGVQIDTDAARFALRMGITSVVLGETTVDTTAARFALRTGATSVIVGEATISTAAARFVLRMGVTTVQGGETVFPQIACDVLSVGVSCAILTLNVECEVPF